MYILLLVSALGFISCSNETSIAQNTNNNITKEKDTISRKKMKVEIWSDVVCPFCYLGKERFEQALGKVEYGADIEVIWHSFQLNPDMPMQPEPMNSFEYLAKYKGISSAQSEQMHQGVLSMAKEDGLIYNFDKTIMANTFNAHRVLQMAKTEGKGSLAESRLFKAFFTEGANLNDKMVLAGLAAEIGMNKEQVLQMLEGTDYSDAVKKDLQEAEQLRISGVPFFVFDRKYAVSGAQAVDTFSKTLEHAYKEWKERNK